MKRKNENFSRLNWFFSFLQTIWHGVSWLLHSIWEIIHWTAIHSWHLTMWVIKQPFHLFYYLLNGRVPQFENTRQEEAFWRVKRRYRRRRILTLHGTVFVLMCLMGIIAAGIQWNNIVHSSSSITEEYLWYSFRNDLLSGGFALAIWFVILCIHAVLVRTAQNEDDELERVMEREYERIEQERETQHDYSRLVEQYDEANFEADSVKAKRNHRSNHHLD